MTQTVSPSPLDQPRCFHCSLPYPADDEIVGEVRGEARGFCCIGCKSVCEAIYAAGMEGFYQRTPEGLPLGPPPELPKELALYDIDEVQEEFVGGLGQVRDIHLLIEGIHCAACVWLIEKTLAGMPGVVEGRVNLTGRRLHLRWDNDRLRLSAVLQRLGQIGYAAVPYDPDAAEGAARRQNRHLLYRMGWAAFAMMNLFWISVALYAGADTGEFRSLFHWIGFGIATPTLIYSGLPFYQGAWAGLRHGYLKMDLPIAIGVSITYLYSVYVTVTGSAVGEVYYDTVVNFLFVILVGRYLEAISKREALASTQRLLDLQPKVAVVLRDGEEHITPIRGVRPGDRVLIKPGERVPVDGLVESGMSAMDESMLSGESVPVSKQPGERVSAGAVNGAGALVVQVAGVLRETALGRIIRLVEEAQASKAPIQCTADRIVPWFVAATLGLATLTLLYWAGKDFELALMAATAVLIITCPCAFGMATPMSIAVASGLGARHGILIKNGEVLETLSGIDHVVFDKTGTITEGRMRITRLITVDGEWAPEDGAIGPVQGELIARLAAVERWSEHPLAAAVMRLAEECGVTAPEAEGFTYRPGAGVAARVGGVWVCAGGRSWLEEQGASPLPHLDARAAELEEAGLGYVRVSIGGRDAALLVIEDPIRPEASEVLQALRTQGIRLTLLSGDRRRTAEAVAARLGVEIEVIAEVMPEDKDRVIGGLQRGGHRVAMVGDGINDAPALVRADIGIALGSGTDVSIASADIVLMSSELHKIGLAIALSRRTLRTIRQNIGIAIAYNTIMVPLAMAALITPLVAAVSMPISSLLVIGNAARIRTLFRG